MSESFESQQVPNPGIKLEDVREKRGTNSCQGRGSETAAARGYNAELLANAVLDDWGLFIRTRVAPWVDTFAQPADEFWYKVEVKCCVDRYEKTNGEEGRYGSFKIWKSHHEQLVQTIEEDYNESIYFFIVYTIKNGIEQEVGKLVAPAERVDAVLDNWSCQDHVTMGERKSRQISWRLLLKRLDVSRERFENTDLVYLSDE